MSDDTQQLLVVPGFPALAGAGAPLFGNQQLAPQQQPRRKPRVTPITWTGGADPLLDALRQGGLGTPVLPRQQIPDATQPMSRIAPEETYQPYQPYPGRDARDRDRERYEETYELGVREPGEPVRHAWYPGRRVDLGLVLLPLRLFLGGISIYAGFSKLCDPVYFNGGARGSMMHWLQSLHPWPVAAPLLNQALTHPVGAGLGVAFVQIVVGVLCVLGLWQRFAAALGMILAVVLLVTVSWRSAPVYDAPEIIYLAAWSPLLLAGAPLFSLDGRLAIEAWRRLGERAPVSRLRRRVLRRGFVIAVVVAGSTLLLGSAMGAAVRGSRTVTTVVPDSTGTPSSLPTSYPDPMWPTPTASTPHGSAKPSAHAHASASPHASATASPSAHHTASRHHSSGTGTGTGTASGTGSSSGAGAGHGPTGTGGGTAPAPTTGHHRTGSPSSGPTSGNGVLGGLLGGG
ncbi:DoxX family membrane protein [Streptacidiphilus sp. PB12-B1b]|uniref:DoxX family protein n=1 Tax=Streptacidiphilus sp. PB12-B1b TaxID=2705012 RepID=UPI0015FCD462|nr:DoxX family protein [Streptacidiphilus sp. PB12-B1b]QMU79591.1 DoxX family membrane protein [Streptacidiphilus sp. PB12-B1b]